MRVLFTNGRLPVSLELARQFHRCGHVVYVVDPFRYHICWTSCCVRRSFAIPSPKTHRTEFVDAVVDICRRHDIQFIVPIHEEGYTLEEANRPELRDILFSPSWPTLIQLHDKALFYDICARIGIAVPSFSVRDSATSLLDLDRRKTWILKPVYGRARIGIHVLRPHDPLPSHFKQSAVPYIVQEELIGQEINVYAVARNGILKAFAIYPVQETLDGSSCVYFESVRTVGFFPSLEYYVSKLVRALNLTGQLGIDFIVDGDVPYAIDCNPRATSGAHLFSGSCALVDAFVGSHLGMHMPLVGERRQIVVGMVSGWAASRRSIPFRRFFKHLLRTRDVVLSVRDPLPALMQPFIYVSYKWMARHQHIKDVIQDDLVWK